MADMLIARHSIANAEKIAMEIRRTLKRKKGEQNGNSIKQIAN